MTNILTTATKSSKWLNDEPTFCPLDGRLTDAERATYLAFLIHEIHAHGAHKHSLQDRDWYMWRVPTDTDLTKIFTGPVYPGVTIKFDPLNKVLVLEVMRPAGLSTNVLVQPPRGFLHRLAAAARRLIRVVRQGKAAK